MVLAGEGLSKGDCKPPVDNHILVPFFFLEHRAFKVSMDQTWLMGYHFVITKLIIRVR